VAFGPLLPNKLIECVIYRLTVHDDLVKKISAFSALALLVGRQELKGIRPVKN